jgi:hypothetical protein
MGVAEKNAPVAVFATGVYGREMMNERFGPGDAESYQ